MAEILVTTADFALNSPTTGSDVIVTETNANDVITNLDQNGDYYDSLTISHGFQKDFGGSGTYLQANAKVLRVHSGGDTWISSDDAAGAGSELMDDVLIECMRPGNNVYLKTDGTVHADCVWQRLGLTRGTLNIEATLVFGTGAMLAVGHVTDRASDATLKLAAESGNGNAVPNLEVGGGTVYSDRTITHCSVTNATMEIDTNPCTTLIIGEGGVVRYLHTAGTEIIVRGGGTLDLGTTPRMRTFTRITAYEGSTLIGVNTDLLVGTPLRNFRRNAA
jgi:hypothetical protein